MSPVGEHPADAGWWLRYTAADLAFWRESGCGEEELRSVQHPPRCAVAELTDLESPRDGCDVADGRSGGQGRYPDERLTLQGSLGQQLRTDLGPDPVADDADRESLLQCDVPFQRRLLLYSALCGYGLYDLLYREELRPDAIALSTNGHPQK